MKSPLKPKPRRLAKREEVLGFIKAAPSTLYQLINTNGFPAPIKISPRAARWDMNEVEAWLDARAAERSAPPEA